LYDIIQLSNIERRKEALEYVEAIRDKRQIQSIKKVLKKSSARDYLLFVFGINTGLKITELLNIRVSDVVSENQKVNDYLKLYDEGSGETRFIYLNSKVKKALKEFLAKDKWEMTAFLFHSSRSSQPITRQQAYRIIHEAAEKAGVTVKVGTQSMRKTFGFHAFKQGVAISLLQKYFHHSTPSETLKYIGVSKDEPVRTEIDVNL